MSAISSVPSRSSAPVLAPVPDAGHDHGWAHVLRERGLRATRAGVRVLEIVHEARVPLSHDDLMQALQASGGHDAVTVPNKVTLYRLLDRFVHVGLLRKLQGSDRTWRFAMAELAGAGLFECDKCHQISALPDTPELPALLSRIQNVLRQEGLAGNDLALTVHGLCRDCNH